MKFEKCKIMEEKNQNEEMNQINQKLNWEAPKLYCLDKGKTEGGTFSGYAEGATYNGTAS